MKILLLGHKGYLGSYLLENISADILSERNVYDNGNKYDYVINCIGTPDIKTCKDNPKKTNYSNRDILLDIKKYYPESKIINFSSYYVYDNETSSTETSNVTKDNNYSKQKLEAEEINKEGVNFRIGKLFGNPDITKQNKLTEYFLKNDSIKVDNIVFNPTSVIQVLDAINYELKNNDLEGIFNLSNSQPATHSQYIRFIDQHIDSEKDIEVVDKFYDFSNYGRFAMSCSKISKYITLRCWKEDMIEYLSLIKEKI